jgi:catechol 2,3-dioxygenase-like lactoylglutathione lyase family enzyme
MPRIAGILESSLYVSDVLRAANFYEQIFGFERMFMDDRLCALSVGGKQVLLLFKRGASLEEISLPGGTLPPHDGSGQLHVAFSCSADELPAWEEQLASYDVPVESRINWPRGGKSIYFRDPDENLLELVTPGIWPIY